MRFILGLASKKGPNLLHFAGSLSTLCVRLSTIDELIVIVNETVSYQWMALSWSTSTVQFYNKTGGSNKNTWQGETLFRQNKRQGSVKGDSFVQADKSASEANKETPTIYHVQYYSVDSYLLLRQSLTLGQSEIAEPAKGCRWRTHVLSLGDNGSTRKN